LPIDIPADDAFYSQYGQACMQFVRTQIGADYACTLGHAEQVKSQLLKSTLIIFANYFVNS
jgi:peroxidase